MSMRPWLDVKLVPSAPVCSTPWIAPMAPASDCISTRLTRCPNMFFRPLALHLSVRPAMGLDGVIG